MTVSKVILRIGNEERRLLSFSKYYYQVHNSLFMDWAERNKYSRLLDSLTQEARLDIVAFKPVGTVFGGLFEMTIESTNDDELFYHWFKTLKIMHGCIEVYGGEEEGQIMQRIEFWDAWLPNIEEMMCSTDNSPMILKLRISPATVRYNKSFIFQKNWFITDINQHENTTTEAPQLKIKDVYWKKEDGEEKIYLDYPNFPVTLFIETMDYNEGDTATIKIKSENGRKFEGNKEELIISGKVNNEGIATTENFKINH